MKLYWLPLLKNLRNYMRAVEDPNDPEHMLFKGININIGVGTNATYPYVDLIWAGENSLPKINQGQRTIDLWIDCWCQCAQSDPAELCERLYEMQSAIAQVLETWPGYLASYTFPGGKHYGVTLEIKKLCSDGQISAPKTASRFIVSLSVKEGYAARPQALSTREEK